MKFREKIDIILKTNRLGINTKHGLEKFLGLGQNSIGGYYRSGVDPGAKVEKMLLEKMRINTKWWDSGEGDIYINDKFVAEKYINESTNDATLKDKKLIEKLEKIERIQDKQIKLYEDEINRLQGQIKKLLIDLEECNKQNTVLKLK